MIRISCRILTAAALIGCASPAAAQHRSHHQPEADHVDAVGADSGPQASSEEMNNETGDVSAPSQAYGGPKHAADLFYDASIMKSAREALRRGQGGGRFGNILLDRIEYRVAEGKDSYAWDAQGWYGSDENKFWWKFEGEGIAGGGIESSEVQVLYSRAISPYFDLQAGLGQDIDPFARTYAVIGAQGLAPYYFEMDLSGYVSDRGDITARWEVEYDQRITQRLIVQPRLEFNAAAQDIPEIGVGRGISTAEFGIRVRYEISREFAPFVGVGREWLAGDTADIARDEGKGTGETRLVIGIRAWF